MKIKGKIVSPAWIAAGILLIAYIVSTGRVFLVSCSSSGNPEEGATGERVVRVAHWQLEPGYREGLQWAIDRYNELEPVKEAGVRVEQVPVTERVYAQFLNVHLIAGTAPDLAVAAGTFSRGSDAARFFSGLGNYVDEPNPYNAAAREDPDISESTVRNLVQSPWRGTFSDNLEAGFNENLNDYYAIPVSTWGGTRLFYNADLLRAVKTFALEESRREPEPAWLEAVWQENPEAETGFLLRDETNLAWLRDLESPPETLGQFFLYCYAVEAYADHTGRETLVPISGSNYINSDLSLIYKDPFLTGFHEELDFFKGTGLTPLEMLDGFPRGVWNFQEPAVRGYFDFAGRISDFYPTGYLGLDREQALRRFVLGEAAIISAGGWDASSIFAGVEARDNPEDRFELAVTSRPLPRTGERWAEYLKAPMVEAAATGGVGLSVNKQSKNFDWALDFLKFLTSQPINETFNARAGWLPVTRGAEPVDHMKPFVPSMEGLPEGWTIRPRYASGGISSAWTRNLKRFLTGKADYEEMAATIRDYFMDPQLGVLGLWGIEYQRGLDRARARDRFTSVERFKTLFQDDAESAERERSLMETTALEDEAVHLRNAWSRVYPETPFLEDPR